MSAPRASQESICLQCGASLPAKVSFCWLCRKDLGAGATGGTGILPVPAGALATRPGHPAASPFAPGAALTERRVFYQFSIASMLLIMTLCALVLGAFSIAPGLGIGLAVLTTPALVWTSVTAMRRRARGRPMDPMAKVSLFAATLGTVALVSVAAGAAFYATCLAGFFAGAAASEARGGRTFEAKISCGLLVGIPLGIVAALGVLYLAVRLIRRFRPRASAQPREPA